MSGFDKAWSRIRETAEKIAYTTEAVSQRDAEVIILQIMQGERGDIPRPEAIEYLGRELCSLIGSYRGDGKRSTDGVTY